jgi:hypothetical protein
MEKIGKILPAVFGKRVRQGELGLVQILEPLWSQVAGKAIALHSRPVAYEAGTLTLVADGWSWTLQLRTMSEQIRAEINRFLGGAVVRKVRVEGRASADSHELRAYGPVRASDCIISNFDDSVGRARRDAPVAPGMVRSVGENASRNGRKEH